MSRITAAQARELSGTTAEQEVDMIYDDIRIAAADKKNRLNLNSNFWVDEGYSATTKWKKACDILRKDGFTVKFYYSDGGQFVDMYTYVEW